MADPRLREIKIKTGVLKRAVKERETYMKEAEKERERYHKMKETGEDEYRLKQQVWLFNCLINSTKLIICYSFYYPQEKVIAENEMMIPDCTSRASIAYKDLMTVLQDIPGELHEEVDFKAAQQLVAQVANVVP